MQNKRPFREIPFTIEQLVFFRKEVKDAGDFDALMVEKKALELSGVTLVVSLYTDIEDYKEKYITGIYEPLRKHYDTQAPYLFWGEMNEMLSQLKRDRKQKFHLIMKAKENIDAK
ncbi:MAG: hypothetical protein HY840_06130 [Bacteroidetes bacterium]|nr:hypothetical protein [Bacteroidota bacterium]